MSIPYFPIIFAAVIALVAFLLVRRWRRPLAIFSMVYVLIGVGTYLYWIYIEAGPAHGGISVALSSYGGFGKSVLIAFAAILAWPLWPFLRIYLANVTP